MTSIDKAYELTNEFRSILEEDHRVLKLDHAKICAMICVKEFLRFEYPTKAISYEDNDEIHYTLYHSYWAEVLIEINKL